MHIDKSKYPLALLEGIEAAIDKLDAQAEINSDVVAEAIPSNRQDTEMLKHSFQPYQLSYTAQDTNLGFYFEIRGVRFSNNIAEYWTVFKPQSKISLDVHQVSGNLDQTAARFDHWINNLKGYSKVRLSRKDRFAAEAAQEFYDSFELVDEDANTNSFEEDKQIYLYKLLEFIKTKVEQDNNSNSEEANELVQEILLLETRIPTVTKAVAIKGLSQIYGKLKVFSFKIFMDSLDILKKEGIKAVLYGSAHKVEQAVHYIQQFIHTS